MDAAGPKVLIVDDEAAVLNVVARMMERLGYTAISSLTGKEALRILEQQTDVDLLLLDVVLRDMTVTELVNRSQINHGPRNIIFMSGHFPQLEVNLPRSIPFLQKPFTMEQLSEAVRKARHPSGEGQPG